MQYNTTIPTSPPVGAALRQPAMQAFNAAPVAGVSPDVYAGLAQRNAVDYDRSAQMANADYVQRARGVQQQMAMRGLQQLAQQRENQMNVANTVVRQNLNRTGGLLNALLQGVF